MNGENPNYYRVTCKLKYLPVNSLEIWAFLKQLFFYLICQKLLGTFFPTKPLRRRSILSFKIFFWVLKITRPILNFLRR